MYHITEPYHKRIFRTVDVITCCISSPLAYYQDKQNPEVWDLQISEANLGESFMMIDSVHFLIIKSRYRMTDQWVITHFIVFGDINVECLWLLHFCSHYCIQIGTINTRILVWRFHATAINLLFVANCSCFPLYTSRMHFSWKLKSVLLLYFLYVCKFACKMLRI